MTSGRTWPARPPIFSVFLDANVLARPLTRTLVLVASGPTSFRVSWSRFAELEAERHLPPAAKPVRAVRERFGYVLAQTGASPERFGETDPGDRQIMADVIAAGAGFLVTDNVRHFGRGDLHGSGVSAVNPDLFLEAHMSTNAFGLVLEILANRDSTGSISQADMHALLSRKHRRLAARYTPFAGLPPVTEGEPREVFRGPRCLLCMRLNHPQADGVCEACRGGRLLALSMMD